MMFAIYFPVCLRVVITRLVPGKDKGWRKKIFLKCILMVRIFRQSI
jgi:hypothetical protein